MILSNQSLAIQGRKRVEIGNGIEKYGATPLLLSIRLFACLEQPPPPSFQLSARWSELAFLFHSIDKVQLEAIAILAALREHAVESRVLTPVQELDDLELLRYLSAKCHGNIPSVNSKDKESAQEKTKESLVSRLLATFRRWWGKISTDDRLITWQGDRPVKMLDIPTLVDGILGDLTNFQGLTEYVESHFHASFTLSNLCTLFFWGSTDENYGWFQSLKTALVVLQKIAKNLTFQPTAEADDEEGLQKLKEEYDDLGTQTAASLTRYTTLSSEESRSAAVALLYVVLSSSLIARDYVVEPDCWNFSKRSETVRMQNWRDPAIRLARLAVDHLEQTDSASLGLFREMIQFYLLRLECNGRMHHTLDNDQRSNSNKISALCQKWLESENSSSSSNTESWLEQCAIVFLSRFSDWLAYRGDYIEALQHAFANLELGRHCHLHSLIPWLESRALSHVHPTVAIPNDSFDEKETSLVDCSGDYYSSTQQRACRVRTKILSATDTREIAFCRGQLEQLLASLSEQSHLLNREWARSTVLLALADACHLNGDYVGALGYTRRCLQECQSAAGESGTCISIEVSMLMLYNREQQCLGRSAYLYAALGDRKRADLYALEYAQHVNLVYNELLDGDLPFCTQREREVKRLMLYLKGRKTSIRNISSEIEPLAREEWKSDDDETNSGLQSVQRNTLQLQEVLRAFDKAKPFECSIVRKEAWLELLRNAKVVLDKFRKQEKAKPMACFLPIEISPLPFYELVLNQAKAYFSEHGTCHADYYDQVKDLCTDLCQQSIVPPLFRAEALYLLGLLEVGNARGSGALHHLWESSSNLTLIQKCQEPTFDEETIPRARSYFQSALSVAGPASTVLTRNILRSLILVTGPEVGGELHAWSSHVLLHISIGASHRIHIARSLARAEKTTRDEAEGVTVEDAFQLLDTPPSSEDYSHRVDSFFDHLAKLSKSSWRFVGACLCPTGEMIVSAWSNIGDTRTGVATTACIFPRSNGRVYDSILLPLDDVISMSQQHIEETRIHVPTSREEVVQWWKTRRSIDDSLRTLLGDTESDFFASTSLQRILFGEGIDEQSCPVDIKATSINLSSKFAAFAEEEKEVPFERIRATEPIPSREILESWKVTQLKEKLADFGCTSKELRNVKKRSLIDLLIGKWEEANLEETKHGRDEKESIDSGGAATILVLDEHLQRFPFESLPSYERKQVCRLPSLSFALAKLCELQRDKTMLSINADTATYVLDPESNLPATRKRIDAALRSFSVSSGSMWEGVVGTHPSREFMTRGLTQNNGLFLYYGHGGTQMFFSPSDLQEMLEADENGSTRRLQSSVILMGCSSGKLESVIREGHGTLEEQFLAYLPEGMAISYLAAGAPCVVGNLWDVTDCEIDRFAIKSLEFFLAHEEGGHDDTGLQAKSLAECVALARSTCKLQYLTGSAPVYYGLPVYRI